MNSHHTSPTMFIFPPMAVHPDTVTDCQSGSEPTGATLGRCRAIILTDSDRIRRQPG